MITNYIIKALNYAIAFCCGYIILKYIYTKIKKEKWNLIQEIPYMVLGGYIAALLSQTILPIWHLFYLDDKWQLQISTYNSRSINVIPFRTIINYLTGANNYYGAANTSVQIVNILGNICLFVPFGILFPFVCKRCASLKKTLICGLMLSLFIEIMQYFVERSSDVDDLILNGLGVVIGYMVYKILSKCSDVYKKHDS